MASLNKVLFIGNLTRDPELKFTSSGAAVANFGLAVNRKYKQGEEWKTSVCFIDIVAWEKLAENCAQYLKKGGLVLIEGRLELQTWEKDGQKRSKHEVVAHNIQFLDKKEEDSAPKTAHDNDIPF